MRRGLTILILFFGVLIALNNKFNFMDNTEDNIPENAIRLRIVANSNDIYDQTIKLKVRDEVLEVIRPLIMKTDDVNEARMIIYNHLEDIKKAVEKVLEENELEMNYYVDYGLAYFPAKVYNNTLYPAGKYESVYIVLGEGEGDNWWCVLFPTLCVMDFATTDNDIDSDNVEYSFLIIEKIKEWLKHK